VLLIQYNDYHRASFLNSSSNVSGGVYTKIHSFSQYLNLTTANKELTESLASYRNQNLSAYKKNKIQLIDVLDSIYIQKYQYIPAEVINNSVNKQNNYLTLNVGRNQGIEKDMAVISPFGIVGVVKDVSDNYASVISVLNQNLKISVMIKHSGYFGSLNWEGGNYRYALLTDLPSHITVYKGDTIITSGYSSMFPKGEFVGVVETVNDVKSSDLLSLRIRLGVDFKNISHVMVIKNLLQNEQIKLETESSHD
jgi:rod shape-determining protein MreC